MPRCASSNTPVRRSCAPVNAPFSCPKISLSSSVSGIAAQLIATNGNEARGLSSWIVWATSSFPVPDSPQIEHRGGRRCRLFDDPIHRAHAGAVAHDATEASLLAELTAKQPNLAERFLSLHRLLQQYAQPLGIHRLAQVVVRAILDGLDGAFDRALRRQEDEGDIGELVFQRPQQVMPAHPGHHEVADDDCRPEAGDAPKRFLAIRCLVRLKSPRLHQFRKPCARRWVVFHDEHTLTGHLCGCDRLFHDWLRFGV